MTTPVNITTLTFPQLKLRPRDAGLLRGYFAGAFGDRSVLFHNHTADNGFRYGYSQVQYKVLRGVPTVVGVAEGAGLVMQSFMDVDRLELNGHFVVVDDKELKVDKVEAGVIDELRDYRLASPLVMFNQENYKAYQKLPEAERSGFIRRLLRSHVITALRGIGCEVSPDKPLMVSPRLRVRMGTLKNKRMRMYLGDFTTNAAIPSGIGIGKSTSKGYGTILSVPYPVPCSSPI